LAELVDSIGRSVLGLGFFSIFINDMKMQLGMPVKQGKKRGEKKVMEPIAKTQHFHEVTG